MKCSTNHPQQLDLLLKAAVSGTSETLLYLLTMILEGPNAKRQSSTKPSQVALTLAQLLKFNSVKHARKTEKCTRHVKIQETPLPVYIGVMLHVKTRKKDLMNRLHVGFQKLKKERLHYCESR